MKDRERISSTFPIFVNSCFFINNKTYFEEWCANQCLEYFDLGTWVSLLYDFYKFPNNLVINDVTIFRNTVMPIGAVLRIPLTTLLVIHCGNFIRAIIVLFTSQRNRSAEHFHYQ